MVTELPAATDAALDEARYFVGAAGVDEMAPLVPVMAVLSVAVTAWVVVVVAVVNVTVATPEPFVADVGDPKDPPFELDQVIVFPAVATLLPLASLSCAVIDTELP